MRNSHGDLDRHPRSSPEPTSPAGGPSGGETRWLVSLIENCDDAIISEDSDGRIVTWNSAAERVLGYAVGEVLGRSISSFCRGHLDSQTIRDEFRRGRRIPPSDLRWRRKDGREITVGAVFSPIRDEGGRMLGLSAILREIESRPDVPEGLLAGEASIEGPLTGSAGAMEESKRAEIDRAYLATIVDSSHDAIVGKDLNGVITSWNLGAERLFGYPSAEAVGRPITFLMPAERVHEEAGILERLRRGETVEHFESVRLTRDGRSIEVSLTISPIKDGRGRIVGISKIARDISVRKAAEESFRASERLHRAIGESIPYGLWISDPDGGHTYASESFLRLVGLTQEQCSRLGWGEALHPDDADPTIAAWKECVRTEENWDAEFRCRGADGRWHPVLSRGVPVRDDGGRIVCWAGIHLDIRRLKEAEESLRRREAEYQTLAENSPLIITRFDLENRHLYVNRSIESLTGLPREHFLGKTNRELGMPADLCALWEARLRAATETRRQTEFEFTYESRIGRRDLHSRLVPEFGPDGQVMSVLGVCADVTERRALQAELLSIAEQQQRRIGQDLHDDVGQELTGVGLMSEALADALAEGRSPEAALMARICDRLGYVRERIHGLARGLFPVEVDARGLMGVLEDLASRVGVQHRVESTFECEAAVSIRDDHVATQLYRIAQEAIANAIKHGKPRHIRVRLGIEDGRSVLEIRDDGVGMAADCRLGQGMGLKIMQYRSELIGATLDIGPAEPAGTRVVCGIRGGS